VLPRLADLTLEEKVGQMFVPGADGTFMNATSPAYRGLERLVRDRHVGGIIWFSSNVYETAFLNRRMQAAARLLLETRATVAAIALDVGYDSEAAFNRAFKRVTGVTPGRWR